MILGKNFDMKNIIHEMCFPADIYADGVYCGHICIPKSDPQGFLDNYAKQEFSAFNPEVRNTLFGKSLSFKET